MNIVSESEQIFAWAKDRRRLNERRRRAETAPRRTLLLEGSAEMVLDAIRYYQAPVLLPSGPTGVRLHFARLAGQEARWDVLGGVTLWRCGEWFVLQSHVDLTNQLKLSFDGNVVKRIRNTVSAPRVVERRNNPSPRGFRLA